MNVFEQATRRKIRFDSPKGLLSVEDLWDLPLTSQSGKANLDDIAKTAHRQLKESSTVVSFVNPTAGTDEELQLRFDLVKYVIDVRVAERTAADEAQKRRETKARILELIAKKQDQDLEGKSIEELTALANSL